MKQLMIIFLLATSCRTATVAFSQDPFQAHVRPTDPLTPAQERESFTLPPGFEIQLVASEPDILKPLNMAFDSRGRLWITETTEYPFPAPPDRKGRDNVKILEDTDGDGRADKITTFADGLNIPIGIFPYRDTHTTCIVFSIPYIWKMIDTDGDDVADQRIRLFGPMGWQRDTHGLNNGFTRGFDGWLYACHGFNNETTVQGSDGHTVAMHSGNTYRMQLDGSRIEHFTHGQVNPFGMTLDPLGNLFTADCHSKPIYQLLRGGYYPSFGKPHDGLGFVPQMMNHTHGSTAIAGVAFYTGENFPNQFRGNVFTGNVMTSRVNRDSLIYHGSTIQAKEEPDFVRTTDPWFRPVDIQIGPDGALYVADFYNRIIGHYEVPLDHPGRDRHRGRIWRIVYTGDAKESKPAVMPPPLDGLSQKELINVLAEENLVRRMQAMNLLKRNFDADGYEPLLTDVLDSDNKYVRAHMLWVLDSIGRRVIPKVMQDSEPIVRVHAMKVLSETAEWPEQQRDLALKGLTDSDAFVRRAAADAIGQHPRSEFIRPLLNALSTTPQHDSHLRHTIRMALRNQFQAKDVAELLAETRFAGNELQELASVALASHEQEAVDFLLQSLTSLRAGTTRLPDYVQHIARHISPDEVDKLVVLTQQGFADDLELQSRLLKSIDTGFRQRGMQRNMALIDWATAVATKLAESGDGDSSAIARRRQQAASLVADFKIELLRPWCEEQLRSDSTSHVTRESLGRALVALRPDSRVEALVPMVGDQSIPVLLRQHVIQAIIDRDPMKVNATLSEALQSASARFQLTIAQTLAGDKDGAATLLALVEKGQASARLLLDQTVQARLRAVQPENLDARMEKMTLGLPAPNEERGKQIEQRLQSFAAANPSSVDGAKVFAKNCAGCHQLDGQGSLVGPQLDGIGTRGVERLIEDIVDPNRNVDVAFRTTTLITTDGKVLSGLFRRAEGETLVFADNKGQEFTVQRDQIERRQLTSISLMPENLIDSIVHEDFNNLLAFLLAKRTRTASTGDSNLE